MMMMMTRISSFPQKFIHHKKREKERTNNKTHSSTCPRCRSRPRAPRCAARSSRPVSFRCAQKTFLRESALCCFRKCVLLIPKNMTSQRFAIACQQNHSKKKSNPKLKCFFLSFLFSLLPFSSFFFLLLLKQTHALKKKRVS